MTDNLSSPHLDLLQSAAALMAQAPGLSAAGRSGSLSLQPLDGGANNRVYLLATESRRALLKVYFQHPGDHRDRLGVEFAFARFAWDGGLRALPQPLACDRQLGIGLFEYLEGRQLAPVEVTADMVGQALDFYQGLNRPDRRVHARPLPLGSEACFSMQDHLQCVERRLGHLAAVTGDSSSGGSALEREAAAFIRDELLTAWDQVAAGVRRTAERVELSLAHEIAEADRRLSPSDFGFHNAIMATDGRLRFIDFEYAGWDDPAKMVCDFFCQPAVPVPLHFFPAFVETVARDLTEPAQHCERIALLLPVYHIKWCCILLNDFLPVGSKRRRFAQTLVDQDLRRAEQLAKARRALGNLAQIMTATEEHEWHTLIS